MPYRTFADEQGKSWDIWDVRPERVERRGADRRGESPTLWTGIERRGASDRRQRAEMRMRLEYPLSEGWLVFQSEDQKRRLAPIPSSWESCRGSELRELWEKAEVISPGAGAAPTGPSS